jgi:hypothetical protein
MSIWFGLKTRCDIRSCKIKLPDEAVGSSLGHRDKALDGCLPKISMRWFRRRRPTIAFSTSVLALAPEQELAQVGTPAPGTQPSQTRLALAGTLDLRRREHLIRVGTLFGWPAGQLAAQGPETEPRKK